MRRRVRIFVGLVAGATAAEQGTCSSTLSSVDEKSPEQCDADLKKRDDAFSKEMRRVGYKSNYRVITEDNTTKVVLARDVYYGRPMIQIPRRMLISVETMDRPWSQISADVFNEAPEEERFLLTSAFALLMHKRQTSPVSAHHKWLRRVANDTLPVLQLDQRQRDFLANTTVDGSWHELRNITDRILHAAQYLKDGERQAFHPELTNGEAEWALSVILRRGLTVHPHQDVRETTLPRMYLIPDLDLLDAEWHPDPGLAITFQEEMVLHEKREVDVVNQIARRDMPKNEPVFQWPGRLSNSELLLRHNVSFGQRNPIGTDTTIKIPSEFPPNPNANIRREYNRFNCSSEESFEMRISKGGRPSKSFVRCFRVGWLLSSGWYAPQIIKRKLLLDKWPPPTRYDHEDRLAWTQADTELVKVVHNHCVERKDGLKMSIDSDQAAEFKYSRDPLDRMVYELRAYETATFKNCIAKTKNLVKQ